MSTTEVYKPGDLVLAKGPFGGDWVEGKRAKIIKPISGSHPDLMVYEVSFLDSTKPNREVHTAWLSPLSLPVPKVLHLVL